MGKKGENSSCQVKATPVELSGPLESTAQQTEEEIARKKTRSEKSKEGES